MFEFVHGLRQLNIVRAREIEIETTATGDVLISRSGRPLGAWMPVGCGFGYVPANYSAPTFVASTAEEVASFTAALLERRRRTRSELARRIWQAVLGQRNYLALRSADIGRFGSDPQGSVAMMFGLLLVCILLVAGLAVDFSRAVAVRARVGDAADSAALTAGRALIDGKMSLSEIEVLAARYFEENVKSVSGLASIDPPKITIDGYSGAVNIDVVTRINMTLTRIAGFRQIDFPVSTAAAFHLKDIEIGVALDVTGSMDEPVRGTRKIDALKQAFESFADRIFTNRPQSRERVRVGLAPYSASINLGAYSAVASNDRSLDGCVNERANGEFSDNTGDFFVRQDGSNRRYHCPESRLVPLSDNRDSLVGYVKSFEVGGHTAGHLGVQWAWNLVSDQWAATWGSASAPESYGRIQEGKLLKAVILMTDGEFNTEYHGAGSSEQAKALCAAMKTKGIYVFSVGFGLGKDEAALATLRSCASNGDEYYANASDADSLEAAFLKFANKLTELRVAK